MLRRTRATACALAAFLGLTAACAAPAQTVVGPNQLGMSLDELRAAYPGLERVARPVVAPRGLRGQWRLIDTDVAGLPFETVFFFQGHLVQRIEQLRVDASTQCALQDEFSAVVSATGLRYGGGLTGFASSGVDAFGTQGAADIAAHLQTTAEGCAIRVIYKPTVLRDASTL